MGYSKIRLSIVRGWQPLKSIMVETDPIQAKKAKNTFFYCHSNSLNLFFDHSNSMHSYTHWLGVLVAFFLIGVPPTEPLLPIDHDSAEI